MIQWAVTGPTVTSQTTFPPIADPSWCVIATSDVNADGVDDVIWFHGDSRRVVVWLLALDEQQHLIIFNSYFLVGGSLPPAPTGFRWGVRVMARPFGVLWQLEPVP